MCPILWVIQCYHLLNTFQFLLTDQLITTVSWLFVVLLRFVLVSVFCVSLGSVVFVGFLVALHGDSSMDYVSITQAPFDAHCRHDDVATALIRGICKIQLAVRIDKRPGESHTALDGKKNETSFEEL